MNLGNLIEERIYQSSYGSIKEFYDDLRDIIGSECCAYNTFYDSLNKNKGLSEKELLTASVLLNIDLNKVAMHYVNSRKKIEVPLRASESYEKIKNDILLMLNFEAYENYTGCEFQPEDIGVLDNRIYAVTTSYKNNSVLAYEIMIRKENDDFLIALELIAYFDYFNDILTKDGIDITIFKHDLDLTDKISLLKQESKIYYEIFPDQKPEKTKISLFEFHKSFIHKYIKRYIDTYKTDFHIHEDDIYCDDEKLDEDSIIETVSKQIEYYIGEPFVIPYKLKGYTIKTFKTICYNYKESEKSKVKKNEKEESSTLDRFEFPSL